MSKRSRARHDAVAVFAKDSPNCAAGCAKSCARAPDIARALGAAVGGARRPARSGQSARRRQGGARVARQAQARRSVEAGDGEVNGARRASIAKASPASRACRTGWNFCWWTSRPIFARDGGFIAAGAHAPLDEVRALRDESRRVIAGLEGAYRQRQRRCPAQDQAQWRAGLFHRGRRRSMPTS